MATGGPLVAAPHVNESPKVLAEQGSHHAFEFLDMWRSMVKAEVPDAWWKQ